MPPIDWLSRLLEIIPVSGRAEHRCYFGAPWRLENAVSGAGEIPYHIVLAGSATLESVDGHGSRTLRAGDILLLTQGPAHVLHDGGGRTPLPIRQRIGPTLTIDENDGEGDRLDMLCGRFIFSAAHERLLHDNLPPLLIVNAPEQAGETASPGARASLAQLVGLMRSESADESLGGQAMLSGLSTALFTLALRLASEERTTPAGLLALAAHPRLAGALSGIFSDPGHAWTLPELAKLCGMSRATFIRQFQTSFGRSAVDLLCDVRMAAAANALRSSTEPTAAIGEDVGYRSDAAFQRAFKQRMGVTPAQYRRGVRQRHP